MTIVRWGLLSTANINRRVIPAIRASQRGQLVAVASRSQESAERYARQWEIPQAFGSYEAMLASDAVDAVYISVPNHLHATWSIRALEAGKHVLCEKPFALTLTEVDAVEAARRATGCVISEAFMYRHHPQTMIAGEWMRSGRLGEIVYVWGMFHFQLNNLDNVRLVPEWGGGSLWDVGVYPVSMAQTVFEAPPMHVTATQWIGPSGVDESFSGQMSYANGGVAHIASSFRTPFATAVKIVGTLGQIDIAWPFVAIHDHPDSMVYTDVAGNTQVIPVPRQELYLGEIEDMHAAILDGIPSYVTMAETRNHIRTVLALYKAAEEQRIVALSEI